MEAEIDFLLVNVKRLENEMAAMRELLKGLEQRISEMNEKLEMITDYKEEQRA